MQSLYHYTDFNAMRGIICNGEIWLWNLRRMNDSQEMEYFIKKLKAAVQKQIDPKNNEKMNCLFEAHLKNFNQLSSFASCFSEYCDDAAQWARYAKEGMGVCIAFNKELLAKIGEEGHAPLYKVNYAKDCDQMEIVQDLAAIINSNTDINSKEVRGLFNRLITSSPLFKHPSFISEKEYRLVSLPYNVSTYLGEPHFFVEETNIKQYYIMNLKAVCKKLNIPYSDLFTQIYIGPQARVTKEVLSDYLKANGMKSLCEKIKISECPLRRF